MKSEEKRRKDNRKLLVALAVLLVGIGVGYAALSTNYIFNGIVNVKSNQWEIKKPDEEDIVVEPDDDPKPPKPTIEDGPNGEIIINYTVDLELPGDYYSFIVPIENAGSIDAVLASVTHSDTKKLSARQAEFLDYEIVEVKGEGNDEEKIQLTNQKIAAGETMYVRVTVTYKEDQDKLPTEAEATAGITKNIQLQTVLTFQQDK